jgi:hypothetical protein
LLGGRLGRLRRVLRGCRRVCGAIAGLGDFRRVLIVDRRGLPVLLLELAQEVGALLLVLRQDLFALLGILLGLVLALGLLGRQLQLVVSFDGGIGQLAVDLGDVFRVILAPRGGVFLGRPFPLALAAILLLLFLFVLPALLTGLRFLTLLFRLLLPALGGREELRWSGEKRTGDQECQRHVKESHGFLRTGSARHPAQTARSRGMIIR